MQPILQESNYCLRCFQFLLIFFKFCGIAPISVRIDATKKHRDAETLIFSCSKWEIVYNIVVICCFIVSSIITLPNIYKKKYTNKLIVGIIVEVVTVIIAIFSVCTVILIISARQRSALRIFNKILDVNRVLVRHHSFAARTALSLCVMASLLHVVLWIATVVSVKMTYDYDLFQWCTHVISTFVIYMFFIQYAMIVTVVRGKFQTVNRILSSLATFAEIEVPATLSRSVVGCNPTVIKLKTLRNVHNSLCEICYDLEKFYSLPVFVSISFYFMTLLYDAYKLVSSSFGSSMGSNSILPSLNSIIWLIVETTPLIVLSFNITAIVKETKRTGQVVHKLLNRTLRVEVASQLKQFSLQLLHHDVRFSGYGFFSIDLTLLHSIANSAATYLVILFQLQPNGEKSKGV